MYSDCALVFRWRDMTDDDQNDPWRDGKRGARGHMGGRYLDRRVAVVVTRLR
jgi:hypothetical protein